MTAKNNRKTSTVWLNLLILLCIFVVPFGQPVYAYTFEKWMNTDSSGCAYSIDYGNDDNIYVAGHKGYGWMGKWDFVIASLDTSGDYRWFYHRDAGTDWDCDAYDLVCGSDGNIYATGYCTDDDWFTTDVATPSVNTLGSERWWSDVGLDDFDKGLAIEYGNDGNIYITGYISNDATGEDLFVLSYRTNGGYRWSTPLDRNNANDKTCAIVYGDEMLFVAGYTEEDNLMDFTVVGFDTAGNHDWSYWKDGTAHDNDEAKAIVYGDDGNIYAAGYTINMNKDFTVVKLDPLSTELWINTEITGEANAVVYGGDGNIYAAGYTGTGSDMDFCVVSYNPANGAANWIYTYDGPASNDDEALAIVYGDDGNIYAAGYSKEGNGDESGKDILVISLDDSGNQRSIYTHTSPGDKPDEAYSIVYGQDDYIYVTGYYKETEMLVICLPNDFGPSIPILCKPDSIGWTATRNTHFHWHPSVDQETSVNGYRIEYDIDPLFTSPTGFNLSDTTKLIQLPDRDTTYYWRVKAKDDMDNWGDWSNVWMVTLDRTSPIVPSLVSPADGSVIPNDLVTIEWTEVTYKNSILPEEIYSPGRDKGPPSPIRYVVQFATDESFANIVREDTVAGTDTTVDLDDDWYWWRVYAFDLAGNTSGSYSEEWSFALDISNPIIDSTTEWLDTSYQGPFEVYGKITDATTVDSVVLFYRRHKDENDFWSIKMDPSVGGEWYKKNIPAVNYANDTVSYYIYAWDIAGHMSKWPEEAPDEYWSFVAGVTGVEEGNNHPVTFSFGLKNNPAVGKAMFSLALPTDASINLNIYDASGRLIDKLATGRKSAGYYEIPWTSKANAAGVYFYSFESSYKNEIGKLILVK
jgi:hypothetical protein